MTACPFAGSPDIELEFYGELDADASARVRAHIAGCPECRRQLEDLSAIRDALADAPLVNAPPAGDWSGFMRRLDTAVGSPAHRPMSAGRWQQATAFLVMAATVALVTVAAVLAVRSRHAGPMDAGTMAATTAHPTAPAVSEPVRSLVEHSEEHLERSKLVVLGLATRDPHDTRPGDWAYERELAGSLLPDTRLYRLAAENRGMTNLAQVMGDLETLLLETSMSDTHDPQALQRLQRLIARRDLVVKMQVVGSAGI